MTTRSRALVALAACASAAAFLVLDRGRSEAAAPLDQAAGGGEALQDPAPPADPEAAGGLTASPRRDDALYYGYAIDLAWTPAASRGTQQRIQWGPPTKFEKDYSLSEPLPGDASSFTLREHVASGEYRWRVLTLQGRGWVPSAVGTFRHPEMIRRVPPGGAAGLSRVYTPLAGAGTECETTLTDVGADSSDGDSGDPDGASGGRVNGMATVAGDNQTYYVASEWGGVHKSTDGGLTWDRLTGHEPVATWDVEVDPGNTQIVYATSFFDGRTDARSGIQVSYDAGATWTHPASAVPNDPADEGGPGDNTPQAGYSCGTSQRAEPSAFGISVRSDAPQNVYVGTNCGLAISADSGATWIFVDPSPFDPAGNVFDVVAQPGGPNNLGIIDTVGVNGHHRSVDGGLTWSADNLPAGASGGSGRSSIAVSPDESYVLFVAGRDNQLYESDDAGATWTQIGRTDPVNGGGRIPFVVTNDKTNGFDLWTGGVSVYRAPCTTPNPPQMGGANRCPGTGSWFGGFTRNGLGSATGAHDDVADIVFDSETAVDAVPRLFSCDGGVYWAQTTSASPQDTSDLVWEQPDRTPHGLWIYGMAGVNQPGDAEEDIYIGCQDNGVFANTMIAGDFPTTTWHNRACCDGFDLGADDDTVLYTRGFFGNGRAFRHYLTSRGMPGFGESQINTYPQGGLTPSFNFAESIDTWGDDAYAVLMQDCIDTYPNDGQDNDGDGNIDEGDETNGCPGGVPGSDGGLFITSDILANPIVWTELGPNEPFNSNALVDVQVGLDDADVPTFYVSVGAGRGRTADQLWKFVGTDPTGSWTRVDDDIPGALGVSVWTVDPNDSNRLYACALTNTGPEMWFSLDAGGSWDPDGDLDNMMQGGGEFPFQNVLGPTEFTGFGGYPQPFLLAFDPLDSDIIVAGGRDSGIFVSRNGGARWGLLSDPFEPASSGTPHVPRPWFAHFDHDASNPDRIQLYVGTQGFGVWEISFAKDVPVLTVPGDLYHADTCVGSASVAEFNVCNTGGDCANLEVFAITSSDPQFSVDEPLSGYPVEISKDFCFPFQARFEPTAEGPQAAILTIESSDPVTPVVEVLVFGTGLRPHIETALPRGGDFGDVCLGDFADEDLVISNSGGCPLVVVDVSSDLLEFAVAEVMDFPLVVAPGGFVPVPIRFEPNGPYGPRAATLTVTSNDPDEPFKDIDVSGNVPSGDIVVTGPTDFGDVCAEELAELTLDVCNTGLCTLNVASATIDCLDFTIQNNPFPAPISHDFCLGLTIRFTPTSAGPKSCTLTIVSDDPDTPVLEIPLTGNTPFPMIDVPPDQLFPPTVVTPIGNCASGRPFPISNTGECRLEITNIEITGNPAEYSLSGLPSFPILLDPGHIAGDGDLSIDFHPSVIGRERSGEISVTYVSEPITGDTTTVVRSLCGEGVHTGARILVTHQGVPLDLVKMIRLRRLVGNVNGNKADSIDNAKNLPLEDVLGNAPCATFQYHREYGTVSNPIQLPPGNYLITVQVRVGGKMQRRTQAFSVTTCGFEDTVQVDFP